MIGQIYYREIDAEMGDGIRAISIVPFIVHRVTPKGVWIIPQWMHKRGYDAETVKRCEKFVLHSAGKKRAYPTKEEARKSYIIRKEREIQHAAKQHDKAVELLAIARGEKPNPTEVYFASKGVDEFIFT